VEKWWILLKSRQFARFKKCGLMIAPLVTMPTTFTSIYKKMASSVEAGGAGHAHVAILDPARHISPIVAHELNNILTIIQGYSDRLLLKHGENPALEAHLKLISEAARRAATIVRSSVTSEAITPPHPQSNPQQLIPAA
jgi:hypothetical protein